MANQSKELYLTTSFLQWRPLLRERDGDRQCSGSRVVLIIVLQLQHGRSLGNKVWMTLCVIRVARERVPWVRQVYDDEIWLVWL